MGTPPEGPTVDQLFVLSLVAEEGGVWQMSDYGVEVEYLSRPARDAVDFVREYVESNGEPPGQEVIVYEMDWPEVDVDQLDVTLDYLSTEIRRRATAHALDRVIGEVESLAKGGKDNVFEARDRLIDLVDEEIREMAASGEGATSIFDLYPSVVDHYQEIKAGEVGIPTPWPTITQAIHGWEFGDTVWWLGRPGTGKTWVLLLNAIDLHERGMRVLVISPELTEEQIAQRHACIMTGTSFDKFKDGKLGDIGETRFMEAVNECLNRSKFWVDETGMDVDRRSVERLVDRYDPDVICLDSVVLYGDGRDRGEQVEDAAPWVVELARRGRKRLVHATSQLNRRAEDIAPKDLNAKMIFGSDAIYQDADAVYGLVQDEEMDRDDQMAIPLIKIRHGTWHEPLMVNWDLDAMNFDEVVIDEYDRDDDGEGGGEASGVSY